MRAAALIRRMPGYAQVFRARHGSRPRFECPVCAYRGPFMDVTGFAGVRRHAECPRCGALERHRLQSLVLQRILAERDTAGMKALHFAPEKFLRRRLGARFGRYETADIEMRGVDHAADIRHLPFADASYDFVFASHVLEHVAEDRQAVAEIRRVLRAGGIAVLPVPVVCERTIEYAAPNPHEAGHVRAPGRDYFDRYRERFARVEVWSSEQFPEKYQLFAWEDRSVWPTAECPQRPPMAGERHADFVPVCYA